MRDEVSFAAPFGVLGKIAEAMFVERYLKQLLLSRNRVLKEVAESDEWQKYL
jgi:hypothetical protein